MKRIINPCMCDVYNGKARGFVKIEYGGGRLSLSGVIGPIRNGDAKGSCGQCTDEIRKGEPTGSWSREMLDRLCRIWDEWHLNDMRPYCNHQKSLGWDKLAVKKVPIYHYTLKSEVFSERREIESDAMRRLKDGEYVHFKPEELTLVTLPLSLDLPEALADYRKEWYKPDTGYSGSPKQPIEMKALGWLHEKDHPEGILGKACPVCGYKYGTKWIKEDVPEDIVDWLFSLPETEVTPAWI